MVENESEAGLTDSEPTTVRVTGMKAKLPDIPATNSVIFPKYVPIASPVGITETANVNPPEGPALLLLTEIQLSAAMAVVGGGRLEFASRETLKVWLEGKSPLAAVAENESAVGVTTTDAGDTTGAVTENVTGMINGLLNAPVNETATDAEYVPGASPVGSTETPNWKPL